MIMFLRFLITLLVLFFPVFAIAQQDTWEPPYRGDDPTLLYLPDTKATYWRYGWTRKPGDINGIIITGNMPDVRYFSYNVYDDNTKSTLGSFTDFQIATDNEGINPFSGKGGDAQSAYTIHVLPEGTNTDAKNVLYFPDKLTKVSVFLRHYVAQKNIGGGVPLPNIAMYEPVTKTTSIAPASSKIPALSKEEAKTYLIPMFKKMVSQFEQNPEHMIESLQTQFKGDSLDMKELIASQVIGKAFNLFKLGDTQYSLRLQTAGTYPNQDNYYLALPIIRTKNQALLARFKVPKTPQSRADYPDADVRYFSLSQGDKHSYTLQTIIDVDMKIDSEGFANFIIANDTSKMRSKAKSLGVNFMPWKTGDEMLLIYRHMLPDADFKFGVDKVASYDKSKPAKDQLAVKTIGAYALVGKLVSNDSIVDMKEFPKF